MICEITEDKLIFKDANLNFRYTACFFTKNNVVQKKQNGFCIHISFIEIHLKVSFFLQSPERY